MDERCNLDNGTVLKAVVRPEAARGAVAKVPGSRGSHVRQHVWVVGDREMRPRAAIVGPLQPNPSGSKRDANAKQVTDAQPSKVDRAANPGPVHLAVSAICIFAARPKEATDHLIDASQSGFVEGDGDQEMSGDDAEHMVDKGEPVC